MSNDVLVGYLGEPQDKVLLSSEFFPSKFGGKPAWLDPKYLPSHNDLSCSTCGLRLRFLLQLYAPLDEREDLFHRTLFVFVCVNCSQSAQVYRCQLPRKNDYYDFDPIEIDFSSNSYKERIKELEHNMIILNKKTPLLSKICDICGMPIPNENANYHEKCSQQMHDNDKLTFLEHSLEIEICSTDEDEEEDEEEEEEEEDCETGLKQNNDKLIEYDVDKRVIVEKRTDKANNTTVDHVEESSLILDEVEFTHEDSKNDFNADERISAEVKLEEIEHKNICEYYTYGNNEAEKLDSEKAISSSKEYGLYKSYEDKLKESIDNVLDHSEMKAFEKISDSNGDKDKLFEKFISRSRKYKGHIVRYSYKGDPLWISEKNRLLGLPPRCSNCNGARVFEFQVQPETIVLAKLQNSKVDFGILAVYTCSNNCKPNVCHSSTETSNYIQEFIYIQKNPY